MREAMMLFLLVMRMMLVVLLLLLLLLLLMVVVLLLLRLRLWRRCNLLLRLWWTPHRMKVRLRGSGRHVLHLRKLGSRGLRR
jgi:hypothetical protein